MRCSSCPTLARHPNSVDTSLTLSERVPRTDSQSRPSAQKDAGRMRRSPEEESTGTGEIPQTRVRYVTRQSPTTISELNPGFAPAGSSGRGGIRAEGGSEGRGIELDRVQLEESRQRHCR